MKPASKFIFRCYHTDHREFYTWSLRRRHTQATSLINVHEKLKFCPSLLEAFVSALENFREFALFQRHNRPAAAGIIYRWYTQKPQCHIHNTSLPQPETYRYSWLADLRSFRISPFCPESSHWACYSTAPTLLPATPLSDAAIRNEYFLFSVWHSSNQDSTVQHITFKLLSTNTSARHLIRWF